MQDGIKRSKGISNISSLGLINDEVRKAGVGGGGEGKKIAESRTTGKLSFIVGGKNDYERLYREKYNIDRYV